MLTVRIALVAVDTRKVAGPHSTLRRDGDLGPGRGRTVGFSLAVCRDAAAGAGDARCGKYGNSPLRTTAPFLGESENVFGDQGLGEMA